MGDQPAARALFSITASITLLLAVRTPGLAATKPFAPPNIIHILNLQGTGIADYDYEAEPCSQAGLTDANRRAGNAYENRDAVTLNIEQHGFAIGFARCALSARTRHDFLVFLSAYATATRDSLMGARGSHGAFFATDRAHARQVYIVCKWLLEQSDTSPIDKSNARQNVKTLRAAKLI